MANPVPNPPGSAPAQNKVGDLVAEFMEARQRDHEAALKAANKKRGPWPKVIAGLAAAAAWIVPVPRAIPENGPSVTTAGMRMEMFLAAQRVRQYRRDHGRLPGSLEAAGVHEAWIGYTVTGDSTFALTGSADSNSITYASTMADSSFIREAKTLRGGL